MSDSLSHPGPAPSAAPNSGVSSLTGHLMKIPNTNKALRIQRRKTKKERNTSRFVSHTEVFKKRLLRGVLGRRGALGGMVCQTGLKDVFNPRPVFITENRLTQHQGIFNHKVKSIDVGRLVGQTAEVGPPNTGTAPCTVGSIRDTPQSQRSLSLELIPTTQSKTQDLLSHQKEPSPEIPEAAGKCQPCPQSRDRPPSEISTSPFSNDPAPILETAESLVAILHTLSLFPGRNLMNETQQALLKKMRCLRDTTPTPCATPAQRIPGYKTPGSSAKYEERRRECLSNGSADIRRTGPRTQTTSQSVQTPPTWTLPTPRNSQTHTLIKMGNPGDHPKPEEIVRPQVHYRSDCDHQWSHPQTLPRSLSRRPSVSSSGPGSSRQDGRMSRSPADTQSPAVRWRLPNDLPTDPSFTCSVPSHNIRRILVLVTNQDRAPRTPLQDVSNQAPDLSIVRMLQCLSGDVIGGSRGQRSPPTRIRDIHPAPVGISSRDPIPRRTHPAGGFGSLPTVFVQTPVTAPRRSSGFFSLDLCREPGREWKRRLSSEQEPDVGQPPRRVTTSAMTGPRHLPEAQTLWNPTSQPREEPARLEKDGRWIHSRNCPHVRSHVEACGQRTTTAGGVSAQPAQHKFSTPNPPGKQEKKGSESESSSKQWVYPRMKLY